MTFVQRRNRLRKHFSEHIPLVKRRITILKQGYAWNFLSSVSPTELAGGSENTLLCGGQISVRPCWCLGGSTVCFVLETVRCEGSKRAKTLCAQCQGMAITGHKNMAKRFVSWRQASTGARNAFENHPSQITLLKMEPWQVTHNKKCIS